MIKPLLTMPPRSAFDDFRRNSRARMEPAALIATHETAGEAKDRIRAAMAGAGLGTLGNALGHGGDRTRRRSVLQVPGGFKASGYVFIRSQSERTRGTIESYSAGSEITPKFGRYLWIATDDIKKYAGLGGGRRGRGYRMTPATYRGQGFEQKIGPLVFVRSASGTPLLIVKNVGLSAAGKSNSARRLNRNGQPKKGDTKREAVVAFYGIPRTRRAARLNVPDIIKAAMAGLPDRINKELDRK